MALRFLDSFDHYTTLTQKWNTAGDAESTIAAGAARTGAAGHQVSRPDRDGPALTLDNQGTWIVGFAYRRPSLPQVNPLPMVHTVDVATTQGRLLLNVDGTLRLDRGSTQVAVSAFSLLPNVWYYIEFKHIIDPAAGTLEVRVDGAVRATFAGNTRQSANSTANVIILQRSNGNFGAGGASQYDDLYILDGTGAAPNNTYWGNTQVQAVVPTGAGNYTEWTTLFGAATHWQAEIDIPPDEDTSYVESATLNQRDTYAMGNITPASATINGIQVLMRARTTLAGADNIARMYRAGGVDYQGADVPLQNSYNYIREVLELDPNAGPAAWTVAAVNAMEMGARVR